MQAWRSVEPRLPKRPTALTRILMHLKQHFVAPTVSKHNHPIFVHVTWRFKKLSAIFVCPVVFSIEQQLILYSSVCGYLVWWEQPNVCFVWRLFFPVLKGTPDMPRPEGILWPRKVGGRFPIWGLWAQLNRPVFFCLHGAGSLSASSSLGEPLSLKEGTKGLPFGSLETSGFTFWWGDQRQING